MKNFILIFSSILFFSCTPQKSVTNGVSSSFSKTTNKGMKMFGKVVVKSNPSADGKSEIPTLYFDNGTTYLINFLESEVSKSEVQKNVYKEIDIVGEVKTGRFPSAIQNAKKEAESFKKEQYIVIYKIIN